MFIALRKCQQLENDFSFYEIIKSHPQLLPQESNAMFWQVFFCISLFGLVLGSHQTIILRYRGVEEDHRFKDIKIYFLKCDVNIFILIF